ncbi:hypothetical protein [Desulfovermiculus halophilus]|uniref:hypothetical protein n=1 Tax=Desulfovermiculus halophilus TaxID=339722 RepID=UPI0004843DA2|nr:hypothetical protein [Desulfovermiculus halophilus]
MQLRKKNQRKWMKEAVVALSLFVLGRAFQSGARRDHGLQQETAEWPEGLRITLQVLPDGPHLNLCKQDGQMKHLKQAERPADLEINFKNIECALMLLTPRMGLAQGFAEHRISIVGDLNLSMSFTRCMNIMLSYFYPECICRRLLKRIPQSDPDHAFHRIHIYLVGIPFGK